MIARALAGSLAACLLATGTNAADDRLAPALELTPLRFYDFRIDEQEITRRNASLLYAPVQVHAFRGIRPVAILFAEALGGEEVAAWNALHAAFGDRVQFLFVYVAPAGAAPLERVRRANQLVADHALELPALVETEAEVGRSMIATHDAVGVLIDRQGRIAHEGTGTPEAAQLAALLGDAR